MVLVKTPPQSDYGTEVDDGARVSQPAANARQGVTEHNVRYVLAASLAGIVAVFGARLPFLFLGLSGRDQDAGGGTGNRRRRHVERKVERRRVGEPAGRDHVDAGLRDRRDRSRA